MSNPTLFAILATYQVRENYNLDDPKGAPYWKNKGGKEVVAHAGLTLDEMQLLDVDAKEAMVAATTPESDEYYAYDLIDWEVITLDTALIASVREFIKTENTQDLGFVRYCYGGTEFAFDWACKTDPSLLDHFEDQWYMNAYDKKCILGDKAA